MANVGYGTILKVDVVATYVHGSADVTYHFEIDSVPFGDPTVPADIWPRLMNREVGEQVTFEPPEPINVSNYVGHVIYEVGRDQFPETEDIKPLVTTLTVSDPDVGDVNITVIAVEDDRIFASPNPFATHPLKRAVITIQGIDGGIMIDESQIDPESDIKIRSLTLTGGALNVPPSLSVTGPVVQLGNFTPADANEWPRVTWFRGGNWDEGLIKVGSATPAHFRRAGFGIHIHHSRKWGIWSSSWTPLFEIEGGTGHAYLRGELRSQGVAFDANRGSHIERDGALYRYNGQAYLTADDHFYIRAKNATAPEIHFKVNAGELNVRTLHTAVLRLKGFSDQDRDEWPYVEFYRDPSKGWDEGIIKTSSKRGHFRRAGFGIHIHRSRRWGVWSTNLTALFEVEGGTGNAHLRGRLTQSSSREHKENIATLGSNTATQLLDDLRPIVYNLKADATKSQRAGFIAEETPDLVTSADKKAVATTEIVPILTRVIKDQQSEIAELRSRLERVEAAVVAAGLLDPPHATS